MLVGGFKAAEMNLPLWRGPVKGDGEEILIVMRPDCILASRRLLEVES